MSKDYSLSAATAERLIKKFGAQAYLVTTTTTGGGPYTPGTVTETETAVYAAVVDYTAREREGTSIQLGDRRALVSVPAGAPVPDTATILRFKPSGGDVDYQIAAVNVIQPAGPAGRVVMTDLQIRT